MGSVDIFLPLIVLIMVSTIRVTEYAANTKESFLNNLPRSVSEIICLLYSSRMSR